MVLTNESFQKALSNDLPISSLCSELDNPDDVVVHFLYLDVLPDGRLYVLQDHHTPRVVHKTGDMTVVDSSNPPHPPHPVDVVRGVQGEVVVYNVTAIIKPLLKTKKEIFANRKKI